MELLADLAAWSLLLFGLLLFSCQMIAHRIGYAIGHRRRAESGDRSGGVGLVVNSLLGLLAFTLALTLSYGSTRYDERRVGALTEAKTIGTAWMRAEAIGHPLGREIADLVKQYGMLRRDYVLEPRNSPAIGEINRQSSLLQSQIWERLSAVVRERSDNVASSLMAALNDMFDASAAERVALDTKMPHQLFWLLIGMALVSTAAFGYQLGLNAHELGGLLVLLVAVWTAVLVVILEMSAPRLGDARTRAAVYDLALEGMVVERPLSSSTAAR